MIPGVPLVASREPVAEETWRRDSTTVLLVDDEPDFRWVVRRALERTGQFEVVAEAADGLDGTELVMDHGPDVVLLDIDMPRMDGLQALDLILRHRPETQVVMVTATVNSAHLEEALARGARGIIRKGASLAGLVSQLRGFLDPGPGRELELEGAG